MSQPTETPAKGLVRTQGGTVVHRGTCPYLRRTKYLWPWRWADRETWATVREMVALDQIAACRRCKPLHEPSTAEEMSL